MQPAWLSSGFTHWLGLWALALALAWASRPGSGPLGQGLWAWVRACVRAWVWAWVWIRATGPVSGPLGLGQGLLVWATGKCTSCKTGLQKLLCMVAVLFSNWYWMLCQTQVEVQGLAIYLPSQCMFNNIWKWMNVFIVGSSTTGMELPAVPASVKASPCLRAVLQCWKMFASGPLRLISVWIRIIDPASLWHHTPWHCWVASDVFKAFIMC